MKGAAALSGIWEALERPKVLADPTTSTSPEALTDTVTLGGRRGGAPSLFGGGTCSRLTASGVQLS